MARKVVGLIGKGTGPKVFVGGAASIEVLGAEQDVKLTVFWLDGKQSDFSLGNGRHIPIAECHYVQLGYEGNNRSMICNVHLEA